MLYVMMILCSWMDLISVLLWYTSEIKLSPGSQLLESDMAAYRHQKQTGRERSGVDKSRTEVTEGKVMRQCGGLKRALTHSRVPRIIVESCHQRHCPFAHALVKIDRDILVMSMYIFLSSSSMLCCSTLHLFALLPFHHPCGSSSSSRQRNEKVITQLYLFSLCF